MDFSAAPLQLIPAAEQVSKSLKLRKRSRLRTQLRY
jgi:hypothetical protein